MVDDSRPYKVRKISNGEKIIRVPTNIDGYYRSIIEEEGRVVKFIKIESKKGFR